MCKYCDMHSLKQMHDNVDAILSEDYNDSTEDRLDDALDDCTVFTIGDWGGYKFYFLDGTYWDEDRFSKWYVTFKHCPMCGRELV